MSIYGVGASYEGVHDMSGDFIKARLVGSGWPQKDAPEIFQIFNSMKVGDLVYIKAAPPGQDITIKAIGIICDTAIRYHHDTSDLVQIGRNVIWINTNTFKIARPAHEKNNVRLNTVYEERHHEVQAILMATIKASVK